MKIYKVLSQVNCEGRFYDGSGKEIGRFRQKEDAIKFAEQYALTSNACFPSIFWEKKKAEVYKTLCQEMSFIGAYERIEIKQSNVNAEKVLKLFTLEELEKEIARRRI